MNWIFLNVSEVIEAWIFFVFDSSCWCVVARDRIYALFTFKVYLYWSESESESDFYLPQTKFAKVMFSQVTVCPRGRGVSAPLHAGIHPPEQTLPPAQWMLGYGQQAGVRIPLECILVFFDLCRCCCRFNVNIKLDSLWTQWMRRRFRFPFRSNINEPLMFISTSASMSPSKF